MSRPRPVVLCILDGWGEVSAGEANAIGLAKTPHYDRLLATYPHATIEASEANVGLPDGQMGNSEVGHMNLGAGRIVMQELPRINQAVRDGSLAENPELDAFIAALQRSGGAAHLMGLLSTGGVHSHLTHMAALARIVAAAGVPVIVHGFLDGRDTPPKSAADELRDFLGEIDGAHGIRFGTIIGRFYAMDRDNRWDRVAAAYQAMASAEGLAAASAPEAVAGAYEAGITDEFIKPTVIAGYLGMRDGDGLLMANFRADRARELLTALLDPSFDKFERLKTVRFAGALGMVSYSTALAARMTAIFGPNLPQQTFGEIVSDAGLTQLRIAETEKYAHVTYFFNGGNERVFPGEERIMVPSPKVATYDLKPEMSAAEITDKLVEAIDAGSFDAIVVNYANADMVGHSGIVAAAVKAIEAIDLCLGRLSAAVERAGGTLLITADHGNAEQMIDPVTHQPHTAHTTNPVPVILVNPPKGSGTLQHGKLADIAPTLLRLLGLPQPKIMTGRSLLAEPVAAT